MRRGAYPLYVKLQLSSSIYDMRLFLMIVTIISLLVFSEIFVHSILLCLSYGLRLS